MRHPIALILLGFFAAMLLGPGGQLRAESSSDALAESPDHPTTWVNGATRERQSLRWSPTKHLLFAYVTYSTADFADGPHPTQEDDLSLTFPTVRLDPATHHFIANGIVVATLRRGLFGEEVALDPKVELSIHRHHGVVYGKLIPREE